ncbi:MULTISPECIES: pantetheine-phosphate adenylyltransferase [unclassified Oceanispirochaeta]|uniref:pantetheine-phosphate adenylyltransferase n=1 Tax=unclassified Oceanispirochaeta TaxID=2635722 RepID=UPI000E08ECEF|nr:MULTISPECIES: pantetheine-phosphate adenylyltransferase [unclassified Oceanispirochaeta]MBF9016111.1 pantetheine-phosphate adenylyltransferase [Oceanispirochaeta sp. M2]NPD72574.1 pantetheine-phosphate adenylyltransferase [Oceanispirochaeta sp. M1]RDG32029.1 pantetheine-phosphate adenylyltransferase [Oceanispirochaeta sp. M1]
MVKAVFPGSFDPPTNGHLNLIKRGAKLFDSVDVVISVNYQKKYILTPEERLSLMKEMVEGIPNVKVTLWDKLIVNYARDNDIRVIMRGVRAVDDFGYEFELSMLNKQLNPQVETIFLPTEQKYFVLRSSSIKELVVLGADVTEMIPENVENMLREKIKTNSL